MSKLTTNYLPVKKLENFFTEGKIQVTNDYEKIICKSEEKINLFNVKTGIVEHSFTHEEDSPVTCFVLTPDNKFLITGNNGLLLKQWNLEGEKNLVRTWKSGHSSPIVSMDVDSSSTLLCTGSADSTAKIWDLNKKFCTNLLKGHSGVVSLVKFNPNNFYHVATCSDNYLIKIWDLPSSQCLVVLQGHFSLITSIYFFSDLNSLLSSSRDRVLILWNIKQKTKKTIPILESIEDMIVIEGGSKDLEKVEKVKDKNNHHVIIAGDKGLLSLWDINTGLCITSATNQNASFNNDIQKGEEPKLDINSFVQCLKIGEQLLVVTADQNFIFSSFFDLSIQKQFVGNNDQILDLKFSGSSSLAVATNSNRLKVYNTSDWSCKLYVGHTDLILCLDAMETPDGIHYLISGSKDNTIRLWKKIKNEKKQIKKNDKKEKKENEKEKEKEEEEKDDYYHLVAIGEGHTHSVNCIVFLHLVSKQNSSNLFLASGSNDKTIKIWKFNQKDLNLKVKLTVEGHEKDINSIAVSPDLSYLASASKDKTAKLWGRKNLNFLGNFKGHKRGVWSVAFSSVDRILATGSADGTIKLWELNSFACIKTFEGHEDTVLKVTFVSRGMQMLSCGSDGLMKLWIVKSNECCKTLDAHDDKIWSLATNQDGGYVATGSADGSITYWKDVTEEEKFQATQKFQEETIKEQKLMNLMHSKHFSKALIFSLSLQQPHRTLHILNCLITEDDKFDESLKLLSPSLLNQLLNYCSTWNKNSRHCLVAQKVLNFCLKNLSPQDWFQMPSARPLVQSMLLYTERHFARLKHLLIKSSFSNYLLQATSLSTPSSFNSSNNVHSLLTNRKENIEAPSSADSAVEMDFE